jgi:dCTP deaminase
MLLSDSAILDALERGDISISPPPTAANVRPVGIRVHLGARLLISLPGQVVDPLDNSNIAYQEYRLDQSPFILSPGGFCLGELHESVSTSSSIVPLLDGRSTLARCGLTVHLSATILDGALHGPHCPALEICNHANHSVVLSHRMPVALVAFARLEGAYSGLRATGQYGSAGLAPVLGTLGPGDPHP